MREHSTPQDLLEHADWMRALARRLVRDEHLAEDLAQDALLAAFDRPAGPIASLKAYLGTVVLNLARDAARRQSRRLAHELTAPLPEPTPATHDVVARATTQRTLVDAVLALREPYRSVVLLRYFDGLPPRKIARDLGIPVSTVHTRLQRAMARLRAELDRRSEGDRTTWLVSLIALSSVRESPGANARTTLLVSGGSGALVLGVVVAFSMFAPDESRRSAGHPTPERIVEAGFLPVGRGRESAERGRVALVDPPRPPSAEEAATPRRDPVVPVLDHAPSVSLARDVLHCVGSDTMEPLMARWSEELANRHPRIEVRLDAKGSSAGPPALTDGVAEIAPMIRAMRPDELGDFEDRYGYPPTVVRVGFLAIAVLVHEENPVDRLTVAQLESMYSPMQRRGSLPLVRWRDVNVGGDGTDEAIVLHGQPSTSPWYGEFRRMVLQGGDFREDVTEHRETANLRHAVARDPFAIGYANVLSVGELGRGARMVSIAPEETLPAVAPSPESVASGEYPLRGELLLYVHIGSARPVGSGLRAFLDHALSVEGQEALREVGLVPLTADDLDAERRRLGF